MKAIFIAYTPAYTEEIVALLEANGQRGFTAWQDIQGRGSVDGIPHLGNHAWPEMNYAVLTVSTMTLSTVSSKTSGPRTPSITTSVSGLSSGTLRRYSDLRRKYLFGIQP